MAYRVAALTPRVLIISSVNFTVVPLLGTRDKSLEWWARPLMDPGMLLANKNVFAPTGVRSHFISVPFRSFYYSSDEKRWTNTRGTVNALQFDKRCDRIFIR